MCFAPQRRAIFPDPNFRKRSAAEVVCTFWLENVLRAPAVCNFWTSELPKVLGDRQFFSFTWKCASCHSGVQFFLSALATSAPAALASLLFDPADTQIIENTQRFVTFLAFRACRSSFYWLSRTCTLLSSDSTSLLCFSSSDSASLLCFSTVHIVGS